MYSKEIRSLVLHQRSLGLKYEEISKNLNISIRAVKNLATYKQKSGPKMKINNQLARIIKRFILNENNLGHKVHCKSIIRNLNLIISQRTLNNHLIRKDFKYKNHVRQIILY